MESSDKTDNLEAKDQVLNVTTTRKSAPTRPRSLKRKWVMLVIIFVIIVAPAVLILVRSYNNTKVENQYEDCVEKCVLSKGSGEVEVPSGNCFEYCRE